MASAFCCFLILGYVLLSIQYTTKKMKKKIDKIINTFKESRTSLEAYLAIHDFIELTEKIPGFADFMDKEMDSIDEKKRNFLQLKHSGEHRGKLLKTLEMADEILWQTDTDFQYRNLCNVYMAIEKDDFPFSGAWLFSGSKPNEPLTPDNREEYQGFLDKIYKKVSRFLERQDPKEETEEDKKGLSFDETKSLLYFQGQKIKIAKQDKLTNAHKILKYIFCKDLKDEFYYSEIAEDEFGDDQEHYAKTKNSWRPYHTACQEIQEKIRKSTLEKIEDFLIFNTGKTGKVRINPKYLL